MVPLDHLNGALGVHILGSQQGMITNEELIHLRISSMRRLHMVVILHNKWPQEAALVQGGSKGPLLTCRGLHRVVAMISMVDKEAMVLMRLLLLHILLLCPFMHLVLPPALGWVHPLPKEITIMDSHRVQIMGNRLSIPKQDLLNRAMGMDMMNQNMKVRLQHILHMEDMVLSLFTHKVVLNQGIPHNSHMVSHNHMAWHHRHQQHNPMAHLGLVNLGMFLIKVPCLQTNHMVQMYLHNNTHMHQVGPCSNLILLMGLNQLLMGIISHNQHPAQDIHSKVASLCQVTVNLVDSRHQAMRKWVLKGVMGHTLHNQDMPNNRLQTMQLMDTKGLQIPLTTVGLPQPMVHNQVASQVMSNQRLLSQAMISQSPHSQVAMELYQQLHQLVMEKVCHPSQVILSMMQLRCMVRIAELFFDIVLS